MTESFVLTLACPDRVGIVYAVTGFLMQRGANITEAAQYNDPSTGLFFMRVRFSSTDTAPNPLRTDFAALGTDMQMSWGIHAVSDRPSTLIMVSKLGH